MYRLKYLIYICLGVFLSTSCTEDIPGPLYGGGDKPGKVTNVTVENRPGGARINYQIPNSKDLLYIKAVFESPTGHVREVKSSMYVDSLIIEGLGNTNVRAVELYAVSRSEVVSEPETVYIEPLTPPVYTIAQSIVAESDFGGLSLVYANALKHDVVIEVMKKENDEWISIDAHYTNLKTGFFIVRGQNAEPTEFGVVVRDRWKNRSDTSSTFLTPLFETKLNNPTQVTILPGDYNLYYLTYNYARLFNGVIVGNDYMGTNLASPASDLPQSFTMDFGAPKKFSRLKYWMRQTDQYGHFNYASPEKWEIWGTNTLTNDWEQWTKIMDCEAIKPSGLPLGQVNAVDRAASLAGLDYNFPPGTPAYRYIRWRTTKTFSNLAAVQIAELAFYGSDN